MSKNVKTLLMLNSSKCARYWAQQGNRVLFISKTPIKNLPFTIGKVDASHNPDVIKLIQFMYLANWQDLLQQLYSIHLRHNPVSVIIVENLENYLKIDSGTESHASLVCASLLYAASICAKITSQPTFLINDYICENFTIEKNIVKNFFHNIWELKVCQENGNTKIKFFKIPLLGHSKVNNYSFRESFEESTLSFTEVVEKVINL